MELVHHAAEFPNYIILVSLAARFLGHTAGHEHEFSVQNAQDSSQNQVIQFLFECSFSHKA